MSEANNTDDRIRYREVRRNSAITTILLSLKHAQETGAVTEHERFNALELLEKLTKG